jgi:hypothetical protein
MDLLDESVLPIRPDLEAMVRARSFLRADPVKVFTHSGKIVIRRLLNDEQTAEQICAAICLGLSARLIGRRFSISPKSVVAIREAMEERGELAPVRLRVQRKLDRVIELGLERWEEGILAGEIHPGQLPIPTLAAIDKRGQLDAGIVPGTDRTVGEVTLEQILAARAVARLAAEGRSDANPRKPAESEVIEVTANAVANAPQPSPALPEPDQAAGADQARTGAGGVGSARAPAVNRGDGPGNFEPKEALRAYAQQSPPQKPT